MTNSVSSTTTDDLLQDDDQNRLRALALESFLVEAPAGAGKTELLTQRYLRLLETVESPEEIIAITFTNKAAGEMRSRIQQSLVMAAGGIAPAAPHKLITFRLATAALQRSNALEWDLLAHAGRMRLTTIDALCTSLARQMPFLSRFGAQPSTVEDASAHYLEAAQRALEHLDSESPHAEAVAVALEYLDNDVPQLTKLLAQMLARREQWLALSALDDPELAVDDALRAMVDDELARIAQVLDGDWQAPLMPLARYSAANLNDECLAGWTAPLFASSEDLARWRAVTVLTLTKQDEPRKEVNVKTGFPAGTEGKRQKDVMKALLAALTPVQTQALQRLRCLPLLTHDNDRVVRALANLMKLAAAELWLVFREQGEVDFSELSTRAIGALGDELDPSDLGLRLDHRIKHLLVDEFQDTSPTQIDLLARLTTGWEPGDGRTLFVVGDPMQSIYRFRKADVGLFLRASDGGIGNVSLTKLRLSRNNRSCVEVVDWINQSFPLIFPTNDEPLRGEISYRKFVATRGAAADSGVTVHPVVVAKSVSAAVAAGIEAERIVQTIAAEWRADPRRKIVVLVSARKHLSELVLAIRSQYPQWRYSAVEIEPLVNRQVVQDLISLTRALHHRADRLHWLAILRAPWCGLVLADLHALAGDDHQTTLWSLMNDPAHLARLSADGLRRLEAIKPVLGEALTGVGRQGRRRWVEDVWTKLGGADCLSSASDASDVAAFFNKLDQLDNSGQFAIDTLDAQMAKLYAEPDGRADGRLELMTIHKSKGLEFDTVILCGLHRPSRGDDPPLLAWDSFAMDDGEQLVVAPVNRRVATQTEGPSAYDYLRRMEFERTSNEGVRVLYVAATRTVRRLHLFGVAKLDADGDLAAPLKSTGLSRLWPALEADFARAREAVDAGASDSLAVSQGYQADQEWSDDDDVSPEEMADFVPSLVRLKTPHVPPSASSAPRLAPAILGDTSKDGNALSAIVGTLAHACLEQIVADAGAWSVQRVQALRPSLEQWLRGRNCAPTEASSAATHVIELLSTTLSSEDGRWVLARHEDDAAELALSTASSGTDDNATAPITRVVDRSFIAKGARWIIDYKTADVGRNIDLDQLRAHAERYRPQLEQYARLFQAEAQTIRMAIYYLAHGKLIELS